MDLTLFVCSLLAAIAAVSAALVRQILRVVRQGRLHRLRDQIRRLQRQQEEKTRTYRQKLEAVRQTEREQATLLAQLADLRRRLREAAEENYVIVHEVGEPGQGQSLFTGALTLGPLFTIHSSLSVRDSQLRGVRHILEVWASDRNEAQRLAEGIYPESAGYVVGRLTVQGGTLAAAE